jgi:uncharacterized protein
MTAEKTIEVSGLAFSYIKSCAMTELTEKGQSVEITERGLHLDRNWGVFDLQGNFISQRDFAKMALIVPKLTEEGLAITAPGETSELIVPLAYEEPQARMEVQVWGNPVLAEDDGDIAAQWFSDYLGTACRLMHVAPDANRNKQGSQFGFADSYPLTIESEESLADLNARIVAGGGEPIDAGQFRSNIRVKGCEPYAEDTWDEITVGNTRIAVVKPVVRCKIPQINQKTAVLGKDPAKTLARYRMRVGTDDNGKRVNEIVFAQKARQLSTGELSIGDNVLVHSYKEPPTFKQS